MQAEKLPRIKSIGSYQIEHEFPQSGQGQVYISVSESKQICVIKVPKRLKAPNPELFLKESKLIREFDHPNIIKVLDFSESAEICLDDNTTLNLPISVLEFAQEGDLFDFTCKASYSEEICRSIFGQIIDAVSYCHREHKTMHLDLKVDNILLAKNYEVKLTDFGHAQSYETVAARKAQNMAFGYGTPWFQPPEFLNFHKFDGEKIDVFNCGLMLIKLATGDYPRAKQKRISKDPIYRLLETENGFTQFWERIEKKTHIHLSNNLKRLILEMIHPDPQKRIGFRQILEEDQWFKQTKPATSEQVVKAFDKQKQKLLYSSSFVRMTETKKRLQKLLEPEKIEIQEAPETMVSRKSVGKQSFVSYYELLLAEKDFCSAIQEKQLYGVQFCSYKPILVLTFLKQHFDLMVKNGECLIENSFGCFRPLKYEINILDSHEGLIEGKFVYAVSEVGDLQAQDKEGSHNKEPEADEEDEAEIVEVRVQGCFLKNKGEFALNWDLRVNKNDYNKRVTVLELKRIFNQLCEIAKAK